MYDVRISEQAYEDYENIKKANLTSKVAEILKTVREDPYRPTQRFERLKYGLSGMCSRRITKKIRFLYEVFPNTENLLDPKGLPYEGIVNVVSMWGHY